MNQISSLLRIGGLVWLLGIISLTSFYTLAHDYIVPHQGLVIASISDKGVNRIAIENDRIAQVIGNEDEYIIESDANLGQIFLTPVLKTPQEISLRFLTERDKIIDVKFAIKKIEPQTINFKYKNESNTASSNLSTDSSINSNAKPNLNIAANSNIVTSGGSNQISSDIAAQQIIDNLKLAYSNKLQGVKLSTLGCLKQNNTFKGLKLVEATQYNLNKQIIVKAVLTNRKKEELLLSEQDFSNCMRVIQAVSLEKNQLAPGASTIIYLVGKDGK
jgi:hypothetical protein